MSVSLHSVVVILFMSKNVRARNYCVGEQAAATLSTILTMTTKYKRAYLQCLYRWFLVFCSIVCGDAFSHSIGKHANIKETNLQSTEKNYCSSSRYCLLFHNNFLCTCVNTWRSRSIVRSSHSCSYFYQQSHHLLHMRCSYLYSAWNYDTFQSFPFNIPNESSL